jgi:cytoskeletal protein RodZ
MRSVAEGVKTTAFTNSEQIITASASMTSLLSPPTVSDEDVRQTSHRLSLSTGGILGIVFGVIAVVVLAAGLFWYVNYIASNFGTDTVADNKIVSVRSEGSRSSRTIVVP